MVIREKIIVFSIFLLLSCGRGVRNDLVPKYTNLLSQFDKNLTSHFPDIESLKNIDTYILGGGADAYPSVLCLGIFYDSIEYESLKKRIEKGAKNIVSGEDTNILIVYSVVYKKNSIMAYGSYNNDDLAEKVFKRNLSNNSSDIVIPFLNFDENINTYSGLSADSKIYHIETKLGKFHNKIPYHDEEIQIRHSLPERLKKGYSRGYELNDKRRFIQYWLVVW